MSLFQCIFFGEFGLLTLTPRYLFGVLFPVMVFIGLFGKLLVRVPFLSSVSNDTGRFFYILLGLGCTTAALASLDAISDKKVKRRLALILVLLIPCSAQLTLILAFASMVKFRVFLVFLLFFIFFAGLLYYMISRLIPFKGAPFCNTWDDSSFLKIVKEAFSSVCRAAVPFCIGSVIISAAVYGGLWDFAAAVCGPFLSDFAGLPPQAAGILLLGLLKRDFAAASLLSMTGGIFDAGQLIVLVLMMTFSMPCFNAAVLLVKQQKLPGAAAIWLGSLLLCLLIGKVSSEILSLFLSL